MSSASTSFLARIDSSLFQVLLLRRLRGVGQVGLRCRERGCQNLPRSRCSCDHQPNGQGHEPCSSQPAGRTPIGDCDGWFATVWRRTTRGGHHFCVSHSIVTVRPDQEPPTEMESLWHVQDAQRNARILSYLDHAPELAWSSWAAKLRGRWSMKRSCFCDSSPEPKPDRCHQCCGRSVEEVWRLRWASILACAAARAFAASLLGLRIGGKVDGDAPF